MNHAAILFDLDGTLVNSIDLYGEAVKEKPHPHGLLLAADTLKADPEECLYIGDQLFDIEAAGRAGMVSCCLRGIYTPDEALEKADYVVEGLGEIKGIIRQE